MLHFAWAELIERQVLPGTGLVFVQASAPGCAALARRAWLWPSRLRSACRSTAAPLSSSTMARQVPGAWLHLLRLDVPCSQRQGLTPLVRICSCLHSFRPLLPALKPRRCPACFPAARAAGWALRGLPAGHSAARVCGPAGAARQRRPEQSRRLFGYAVRCARTPASAWWRACWCPLHHRCCASQVRIARVDAAHL